LREETLLILGNDNDSSEQGRQIKLIYAAPSHDYRNVFFENDLKINYQLKIN